MICYLLYFIHHKGRQNTNQQTDKQTDKHTHKHKRQ